MRAGEIALGEMEEIAWYLRSDPKKGKIGFVRKRDLSDDEQDDAEREVQRGKYR